MIVYIYRFLCGYIKIRIYGDFPERFLNICAFNHIQLWNIRRKRDSIFANVSVKDYKRIRRVKKNKSLHVKLIAKRGIYFTFKPYLVRKGIAVGIALYFVVMCLLSQFIWNIEVVGNKNLSREEVLKYCEKIGIKEGIYSGSIDTNSARLKLLMENDKLSWGSFIIEGSHLTVNISEAKTVDEKETEPANLIATKDGVIEKVTVSSGKAVVKTNQAVLKGDLLATGVLEYSNGRTHFVRCDGVVLARTEKTIVCETPFTVRETTETGRIEKRKILTFFGVDIPLSITPINFDYTKSESKDIITNGSSYSPVYITTVKYREKSTELVTMSRMDAIKYAEKQIAELEKSEMKDAEILSSEDSVELKNERLTLTRKYQCIENIAVQEKIKINNVN